MALTLTTSQSIQTIETNGKKFPVRIHHGKTPKYIVITHHGIMSNRLSWKYFENWVGDNAIVLSYDARLNGDNTYLKASRFASTYVKDLHDVVLYAKNKWPDLKVVLLGSSWGASIVIALTKEHPELIYKSIAWSLPMRVIADSKEDRTKQNREIIKSQALSVKETGSFGYAWKFALMLLFNINTKSYTNIDIETITANKTIHKINRATKQVKATPVKLFYATYKLMLLGIPKLHKINESEKNKIIYIQSTLDQYSRLESIEKIRNNSGQGVRYIELNEGIHAFQWETNNNLHSRVFQMAWDFLEEDA